MRQRLLSQRGSGAAGGCAGDDEVGASRLDPARRRGPRVRPPWGRRGPGRQGARGGWSAPPERDGATYAALDLGTNNCRLLVARPTADGFRVIDAFSRIIRLGEGVSSSRRLSESAMARALAALAICRDKIRGREVTRARLVATEACRAAENGADFVNRVREEIG